MDFHKSHIVLVAAGQPATNPRLLKEALCLAANGYQITVVFCFSADWADLFDAQIINDNPSINWILAGGHPKAQKISFFISRLLNRLFKYSSFFIKAHKKYSLNRASWALIKASKKLQANLYIGHNLAALPAVAIAAKEKKAIYAFDAEDYHRGQFPNESKESKLSAFIEDSYIPGAAYLTAASPLIAAKYKEHYPNLNPIVINNLFSLNNICTQPLEYRNMEVLKLFWFSQTVGSGRGIEKIIEVMRILKDIPLQFTILGECKKDEKKRLLDLADGFESQIEFLPPVEEKEIFYIASQHHIGLALEVEGTINRDICLTNKIFTYLLSGLAIVATNTAAQVLFFKTYPDIGKVFNKDKIEELETIIRNWYEHPAALNEMKVNSLALAKSKYNWEEEQEILLNEVNTILLKQ